jgi:hypothetical protein
MHDTTEKTKPEPHDLDDLPDDLYVVNCHQCQKLLRGQKSRDDKRFDKYEVEIGLHVGGVYYCFGCFTCTREIPTRDAKVSDYDNRLDNGIRCYEDRFDA